MGGGTLPTPPKKKKFPPHFFSFKNSGGVGDHQVIKDVILPLGAKPLEARGEAASDLKQRIIKTRMTTSISSEAQKYG